MTYVGFVIEKTATSLHPMFNGLSNKRKIISGHRSQNGTMIKKTASHENFSIRYSSF